MTAMCRGLRGQRRSLQEKQKLVILFNASETEKKIINGHIK